MYSYIDILLALREVYKKQNRGLEKLKVLSETGAREVVDFHYWVHRWIKEVNPELMCRVTYKKGVLNKYTQDSIVLSSNNGEFFIQGDSIVIPGKNKDEFDEIARSLLDSEIARNMYSDIIKGSNTGSLYSMQIKPSEIRTVVTKGIVKDSYLNYCSYLDRLTISNYPEELNKELLVYLLSLDFQIDNIPEYFQNLLTKYDKTKTRVALPRNLHDKGISEFSIKEVDENRVSLKKI